LARNNVVITYPEAVFPITEKFIQERKRQHKVADRSLRKTNYTVLDSLVDY
jgi:hypothetical protein